MRCLALLGVLIAGCGSSSAHSPGDGAACEAACVGCLGVHGQWQIDNLSPCLVADGTGRVTGATSTIQSGAQVMCPADPRTLPTTPWSTDTLTISNAGHYRLCVTHKAGAYLAPQPSDCVMAQACAEGDAAVVDVAQPWAPVAAWLASGASALACAQAFATSGGYGERSLVGSATSCGVVDKVIDRVAYCPASCGGNPGGPGCAVCGMSGSGAF
jgi:hypothetical protein